MKLAIGLLFAGCLLAADPGTAAGAKLYRQYCSACHGKHGEGKGKKPGLKDAARMPAEALLDVLKNGRLKSGMPSFSYLPKQQREQIAAFVRELK